jgi:hypothetical protein
MLSLLDPVLVAMSRQTGRAPVVRIAITSVGAVAVAGAMVLGAALWRENRITTGATWDEQISATTRAMSSSQISVRDSAASAHERLQYLWMDGIAIQGVPDSAVSVGLGDMFVASTIKAIPAMIFPEKYKYWETTCEDVFAVGNFAMDFPCTAISEGIIFGGIGGFFMVSLAFGIGLGFATLLYRTGTDIGLVLACGVIVSFAGIETSAFPVIQATRTVITLAGLIMLGAAPFRVFMMRAPQ